MRRIFFLFLAVFLSLCQVFAQKIEEFSLNRRLHYKIIMPNSTWFIDKYSGGISSILDSDGKEWIGWKRLEEEKYPESAAGDYRGMPNLVYGGSDNGTGHPGFDKGMSFKENGNQIHFKSWNGKWEWQYTFFKDHVQMQLLKGAFSERNYWFLYEGIPGGEFNPEQQYWGTNFGLQTQTPDYYNGEELYGFWQWVFLGHKKSDRVLFLVQKQKDDLKDTFGFLGNSDAALNSEDGMVVFGFGRGKEATPLLNKRNVFYMGFYEKRIDFASFPKLAKFIQKNFTD